MSIFFEFFGALAALNFSWIIAFILGNLLWLFFFATIVYILFNGQKFFTAFVFFVFAIWLWNDFSALTGVGFIGAKVIAIYYVSKMAILTVVENNKNLKKHLVVISTVTGIASLLLATIFA